MKKRHVAGVVFSVLCLTAGLRAEEGAWEPPKEDRMEAMEKDLGLSPEQKEKLKAHRQSHRQAAKALFEQLKAKRDALRQELEKPSVDDSRVQAIHGELKALHDKMADHRLAGILEVRKILTPEQFKKFSEKVHDRREKRGEGRGEHGRPDRPHRDEK
jgi:Spy/CpxP family protein refolding chaperone